MHTGITIAFLLLVGSAVNVMTNTTRRPTESPVENITPLTGTIQVHTPSPCSSATLFECTNDLVGEAALLPWQRGAGQNVDPALACRLFAPALTCFKEKSANCSAQETLPVESTISIYEYVCTDEGMKDYMSLKDCFGRSGAVTAMANCSDLSQVNTAEVCNIPSHFIGCSKRVADGYCQQEEKALLNIVSSSFRSYQNNFNCDLSISDGNHGPPSLSCCWKLMFLILALTLFLH